MILPDAPWRHRPGLATLLDALGQQEELTRFVGGAVRDTIIGLTGDDVDCATSLSPQQVLARVADAGFRAVPTGIAHGTVTAILPDSIVEITTLRRDVSTDGRRASVAFTDDWREDAARRDFTINALSADPVSGLIHDYFGGLADLSERTVRFIGDPLTRIAEDHLRILRFFRFHARFGAPDPDGRALAACTARANDLMALSRERIADELLKLLNLPDPSETIALMVRHGILKPVLPEIGADEAARLAALAALERSHGIAADPVRRLGILLPRDAALARAIGERLKLSKTVQRRLADAAAPEKARQDRPFYLAYHIGPLAAADWLLAQGAVDEARALAGYERPRLPISGGHLIAMGLPAGPIVAATLQAIECDWAEAGFPGSPWVHERAERAVAQALARQ